MKLFMIKLTNWRTVWSNNKPVNTFLIAASSEKEALGELEGLRLNESEYTCVCLAEECEVSETELILEGFD